MSSTLSVPSYPEDSVGVGCAQPHSGVTPRVLVPGGSPGGSMLSSRHICGRVAAPPARWRGLEFGAREQRWSGMLPDVGSMHRRPWAAGTGSELATWPGRATAREASGPGWDGGPWGRGWLCGQGGPQIRGGVMAARRSGSGAIMVGADCEVGAGDEAEESATQLRRAATDGQRLGVVYDSSSPWTRHKERARLGQPFGR